MKTNIILDAGTTAFMKTVDEKILRQARSIKWLTAGLIVCGIYTVLSVRHIKALEKKVNDTDDVEYTES